MAKSKAKTKRRRITLTLEAPDANHVVFVGDFNNWDSKKHPMKKNKSMVWEKTVVLYPGRYEYKFLVDGHWWNDPKNGNTCYNCFGTLNNFLIV